MKLKKTLKEILPVTFDKPFARHKQQRVFQSFALKRAGQHLVINWICRGLVDAIHLNNCCFKRKGLTYVLTPITGRRIIYSSDDIDDSGVQGIDKFIASLPAETPNNLFYSLEDQSLYGIQVNKLENIHSQSSVAPVTVLVLRDPANWLASSFSHGRSSHDFVIGKSELFVEYLEKAIMEGERCSKHFIVVNYNKFIQEKSYRKILAEKLTMRDFDRAEEALGITARFGGGSSFKDDAKTQSTLERWKAYQDNARFCQALKNPRLIELSRQFFDDLPGYEEMELLS